MSSEPKSLEEIRREARADREAERAAQFAEELAWARRSGIPNPVAFVRLAMCCDNDGRDMSTEDAVDQWEKTNR